MKHLTLLGILISLCLQTHAQEDQTTFKDIRAGDAVTIRTTGGSEYVGQIIAITGEQIILTSEDGVQSTLQRAAIKSVKKLRDDQVQDGEYYYDNPMPNRNFLTETAFSIPKGQGFYQNVMVFVNSFGYGFSDHFSLTGGFETVSLFGGGDFPIFYVQPKYTFTNPGDKTQFAIGTNLFAVPDGGGRDLAGTVYGAATFGTVNNNVTVGAAFAFGDGEVADAPIIQAGGQLRVTKSIGLVTDNIIVLGDGDGTALLTAMLRVIKPEWSFDVGLATTSDGGGWAPILGVNLRLGG